MGKIHKMETEFCAISPKQREGCGHEGIEYDECTKPGCCFDRSVDKVIWCFENWTTTDEECDNTNPKSRVDCGYEGINEENCTKDRICCYDEKTPGVPWCFYKNLTAVRRICLPSNRVKCASYNENEKQCNTKECCFDPRREPHCYKKQKQLVTIECSVPASEKVIYGDKKTTRDECHEKRLCYSKTSIGSCCYWPKATDVCGLKPENRTNCGQNGISSAQCDKNLCCYDETAKDANYCYYSYIVKGCNENAVAEICIKDNMPRTQCPGAYEGIDREACSNLSCCFDNTTNNVPYCYTRTAKRVSLTCDNTRSDRINCGYPNITEAACIKKECCWDNTDTTAAFCFYKKAKELTCDNTRSGRSNCGHDNITEADCRAMVCCWDNTKPGMPYCYYRS
uniref:P-type domain-containing protein n=1 Tax=Leptobrachium leishanense TaxID=445787 RepID=A0A8C5LXL7_9ANUR